MEGEMLWVTAALLLSTLANLHWACLNPLVSSEPLPIQLAGVLDALEADVERDTGWYCSATYAPDWAAVRYHFTRSVQAVRDLGCRYCGKQCKPHQCLSSTSQSLHPASLCSAHQGRRRGCTQEAWQLSLGRTQQGHRGD